MITRDLTPNQQAIGQKHFLQKNGNRLDHPSDGYDFRGRGLIQLTGYEKYYAFMMEYDKYWSDFAPDVIAESDKINNTPYAIRSAIWFWLEQQLYAVADRGCGFADVRKITTIVNGGNMGLKERQDAYTLADGAFK